MITWTTTYETFLTYLTRGRNKEAKAVSAVKNRTPLNSELSR